MSANAQVSWQNDIHNASGYIDAEGREWLPALVDGIPLGTIGPVDGMSAQCNVLTGWCGNQWNSLHWASMDEVAQLITEVTGQPLMTSSRDGAGAIALELGVGYTTFSGSTSYYTAVTRDSYFVNVDVKTDYRPPYTVTGDGGYDVYHCATKSACNANEFTAWGWVAVPEPSTISLMGCGIAMVLWMRRRRATSLQVK